MSEDSPTPTFPGDLPPAEAISSSARFRQSVADSVFQISRAYPKLLALRSTPGAWTVFRVLLGVAGAGLVVLPLSLWNGWAFAPVGLVLFLLAVLLPPIRHDPGTAKAVQQLGAYLVLDGGRLACGSLSPENGEPCAVHLYLTATRVWALDAHMRPVVVIPANEIKLVTAFREQDDWKLRVSWQSGSAELLYAGIFAERRARLAQENMQHLVARAAEPVARAKAASA